MAKKELLTPTPYADLNDVLHDLVAATQSILEETFIGAYLQGSFAVGDSDRHSDVDFIIVIAEELLPAQIEALQEMHERLFALPSPWAQHLEGSYFPSDILIDYAKRGSPLWYLDHGSQALIRSDHCNTIVVRAVLRAHGVTLAGPPPTTLIAPIPVSALRAEIRETIVNWGYAILADPTPYNNRFYQGFIVLNYCRMLHDYRRGAVGSKKEGAAWAKAHLDPSWRGLIDRAWRCRPDPATSVRQPADPADFDLTLTFVRTIVDRVTG